MTNRPSPNQPSLFSLIPIVENSACSAWQHRATEFLTRSLNMKSFGKGYCPANFRDDLPVCGSQQMHLISLGFYPRSGSNGKFGILKSDKDCVGHINIWPAPIWVNEPNGDNHHGEERAAKSQSNRQRVTPEAICTGGHEIRGSEAQAEWKHPAK